MSVKSPCINSFQIKKTAYLWEAGLLECTSFFPWDNRRSFWEGGCFSGPCRCWSCHIWWCRLATVQAASWRQRVLGRARGSSGPGWPPLPRAARRPRWRPWRRWTDGRDLSDWRDGRPRLDLELKWATAIYCVLRRFATMTGTIRAEGRGKHWRLPRWLNMRFAKTISLPDRLYRCIDRSDWKLNLWFKFLSTDTKNPWGPSKTAFF